MKLLTFVCVFSVYFGVGSCIRCYDCNSMNNSMCLDPTMYKDDLKQMFLRTVECSSGVHAPNGNHDFFCRKLTQTILHKGKDTEVRVTRGCGWMRHHKDCYKADTETHLETACQCFTDSCNSGFKLSVPWLVLLGAVIMIFKN